MVLLLKNLLFTVVVPGTAGVYVPLLIAGPIPVPTFGPRSLVGILLLAVGAAGYFWCLWEFAVSGRGTPAPVDPPKHLVVRGPYRLVRNPMYLAVLALAAGWAVSLRSSAVLAYAGALWAAFHLFVVFVEEPSLRQRFGDSYAQYCQSVRRWVPVRPGTPMPRSGG